MSENSGGERHEGDSSFLIILLLLALLLGGIGLGGYWVLGQRRQAAIQAEIQTLDAQRAAEQAAAAQGKAKAP